MSQEIILEPAGVLPGLHRLIEGLDIEAEFKKPLLNIEPRSILIAPRDTMLIVQLNASQLLPRQGMEPLRAALAGCLCADAPPQLVWDVHYSQDAVKAEWYLKEHWKDILAIFSRQVSLAGTYLSLARISNGDGNRIRMTLPNEMSLLAIKRYKGEEILSRLLSERLRQNILVRFEVGDCGEIIKQQEVLYQQRIRQALEKCLAESQEGNITGDGKSASPGRSQWIVIHGRKIAAPSVPIGGVLEEEKQVVIEGEVIAFERKSLRTGRQLILMDIYDKTGSLHARFFLDAEQQLSSELHHGVYVKLRGAVEHDKYSRDLCLMARDIALGSKPQRLDTSVEKRVELHAHSQMSAMDSLANVTQLIARAAEFGHAAIAITDHGVIQAFPEARAAGKKHGVKIIYGMEGYLIEDAWLGKKKQRPYHISILISEPQGVKNLYCLVSESHLKHFYRHPRILRSQLEKYRGGLLLGSACERGELFLRMREGASEEELEIIARKYDYLEIMPRGNNHFLIREGRLASEDELLNLNRRIFEMGRRLGVPVAATGDVHFLEPGDEVFRSILHTGMGYSDAALQAPLFFQTTEEMLAEFAYLGEDAAREAVIKSPREIADRVEIIEPLKRTFHPPRLPNAEEELEQLAFARAREVYGKPLPDIVAKRLAREIMAINNNYFASLFLIARRLVQKSLTDGYLVGSRGSVGSSLTATMLGITEVNPLPGHYLCSQCRRMELNPEPGIGADLPERHCPECQTLMEKTGFDIPFEVFMGFKGDKMPDIDLNFSGEYQSQAHKYLEELFDREHIFRAGTISTVAERTAFGFVKKYLEGNKLVVREVEVNRLTRGCAGVKKTTGQHPGGIMIVPEDMDIHDFTPVQRPADDHTSNIITTHFDYHAIHDALIKLDILGHDDPTSLRRMGDWTGVEVRAIPLDDADTLKIFSGLEPLQVSSEDIGTSVGTLGIPEFGTEFVRQMLEATRPTKFSELVCISGLSHGTDVWLNNAADLIKAGTAKLATVISARDDIMNYLISRGLEPAVAFQIMESVRKGKGVAPEQENAMREFGVPDWYIESCKKIKYIFPKAHAVAYCIMAFRIAYFKVHFPTVFYANYFSLNAECFEVVLIIEDKMPGVRKYLQDLQKRPDLTAKEKSSLAVLIVVQEAFLRGIRFRSVSLMDSDPQSFKIMAENELLPPLISLSGLGLTCALRIAQERTVRPFRSIEELARRTGANKNVVEIMTRHGCLGGMPKTDQTTLFAN